MSAMRAWTGRWSCSRRRSRAVKSRIMPALTQALTTSSRACQLGTRRRLSAGAQHSLSTRSRRKWAPSPIRQSAQDCDRLDNNTNLRVNLLGHGKNEPWVYLGSKRSDCSGQHGLRREMLTFLTQSLVSSVTGVTFSHCDRWKTACSWIGRPKRCPSVLTHEPLRRGAVANPGMSMWIYLRIYIYLASSVRMYTYLRMYIYATVTRTCCSRC